MQPTLFQPDRRRPGDHEVVMTVIHSMRVVAYLLYGSLALCLVIAMAVAVKTGDWGIPILGILITAVATGGGNATGFIGGVLSTTGVKNPQPADAGKPTPVTVENGPENAVPVSEADGPGFTTEDTEGTEVKESPKGLLEAGRDR